MNKLETYFKNNKGHQIMKWQHYFDIYDQYFSRYIGTDVHFLEIGILQGGSLGMWRDYFGPKAKIYAVDINPECKKFEDEGIEIIIGDQGDKKFLNELAERLPRIDILLDDGGHRMHQQINTFDVLYPFIDENGLYVCEDLHTSYWKDFDGGYKNKNTYIEYTKNFIDYINAWHSKDKSKLDVSDFTKNTYALHYYDSMLVIEKKPISPPHHVETGIPSIAVDSFKMVSSSWFVRQKTKFRKYLAERKQSKHNQ